MANETIVTVIGNLTDDPSLRVTKTGIPVASFSVASTPRKYDADSKTWEDGDPLFLWCSAWRELGEHAADSLGKGDRVIVIGKLRANKYTDKNDVEHENVELDVEEIGPSLRWHTATVRKAEKKDDKPARKSRRGRDDE